MKTYNTPFKVNRIFLGWVFIGISIALVIIGGILYTANMATVESSTLEEADWIDTDIFEGFEE